MVSFYQGTLHHTPFYLKFYLCFYPHLGQLTLLRCNTCKLRSLINLQKNYFWLKRLGYFRYTTSKSAEVKKEEKKTSMG